MIIEACLVASLLASLLLSHPSSFPPEDLKFNHDESSRGLETVYFGTTTIYFGDSKSGILIDGFFSRPSWGKLAFKKIEPEVARIKNALACCETVPISAIFVTHSHHDHAMDAGVVAKESGGKLYGSRSTELIARASGIGEDVFSYISNKSQVIVGGFLVTSFSIPHSSIEVCPGKVDEGFSFPARACEFKTDEVFALYIEHEKGKILVSPSANFSVDALNDLQVDISMVSIAGLASQPLSFVEDYWNESVRNRGAKLVIPLHWDDFADHSDTNLRPLPFAADGVSVALDRILKLAKRDGVKVAFLPYKKKVKLGDY